MHFELFLIISVICHCYAIIDTTFDKDNWKVEIFPASANFSDVHINRLVYNETNHTTLYSLQSNLTVPSKNWLMVVLYQNQFQISPSTYINDQVLYLSSRSSKIRFGFIVKQSECVWMTELKVNNFSLRMRDWSPIENSWISSNNKNILCLFENQPPIQQLTLQTLQYGVWILLNCEDEFNDNCQGWLEMFSFGINDYQAEPGFIIFLFAIVTNIIVIYMIVFLLHRIVKNLKKYVLAEHYEIHDTISSSIYDANCIPKRIFNVCLSSFSIVLLFSDVLSYYSKSVQPPENTTAFVFECFGVFFLYCVACFPGGTAFRKAAKLKLKEKIMVREMERLNVETFDVPEKADRIDRIHGYSAVLSISCLMIADAIHILSKILEEVTYRINLIIFVFSITSLIHFFLLSIVMKLQHQTQETKTVLMQRFLSESASFFGIGIINIYSSWSRNATMSYDSMVLAVPLYFMLFFVLICVTLDFLLQFKRSRNKIEDIIFITFGKKEYENII